MFTTLLNKSTYVPPYVPPEPPYPPPFIYERFETDPGYDYPDWTTLADAGSTYDPDIASALAGDPLDWGNLCFEVDVNGATNKGVALRAAITPARVKLLFSAQFVFEDLLAIDPGLTALMFTYTGVWTPQLRVGIEYISGDYKLVLTDNAEAKHYSDIIYEDTLYKIDLFTDVSSGWAWKINDVNQDVVSEESLEITGVQVGMYEDPPFNFNSVTYIDEIKVIDLS